MNPRFDLKRILVLMLLASTASAIFVSIRLAPLAHVSLLILLATALLWEGMKAASGRRFPIAVDVTCYALATALTIDVAVRIDVAVVPPPAPTINPVLALFRILDDALGKAVPAAIAISASFAVAAFSATWAIVAYLFRRLRKTRIEPAPGEAGAVSDATESCRIKKIDLAETGR